MSYCEQQFIESTCTLNQYQYVNMLHANTESTRQCNVCLSKKNKTVSKKRKTSIEVFVSIELFIFNCSICRF